MYRTIDWQLLLHLPPHVVVQLSPGLTGEGQLAHQLHSGPCNPPDSSAPRRLLCWMKDQASCHGTRKGSLPGNSCPLVGPHVGYLRLSENNSAPLGSGTPCLGTSPLYTETAVGDSTQATKIHSAIHQDIKPANIHKGPTHDYG